MAPSGLVIPAAMAVRLAREAWRKGVQTVRDNLNRFPEIGRQQQKTLEPALVRTAPRVPAGRAGGHHKTHSHAYRTYASQANSRFYSTATNSGGSHGASASRINRAVINNTSFAPFSSTLRPRLCGALPRSSGGFSLGGSARYFSHTPAGPSQVISEVSSAMRAFFLSGREKAYNRRKGSHANYVKGQIRSQLAAATASSTPGAYVDFRLAPTLHCLAPNSPVGANGLDVLDEFQAEYLSDISAIFADLKRLSSLGDLPLTLENSMIRVHFRGCTAEHVNALLDEVGVMRGVVHEDERFEWFTSDKVASVTSEMDWKDMMSSSSGSTASESFFFHDEGGFADDFSEDSLSVPIENGEEFYDEIDPGGESFSSSSNSSYMVASHPLNGVMDVEDSETFRNPWATPAMSVTASA